MTDRLAEIKCAGKPDMYGWVRVDSRDFNWLISEVERLQKLVSHVGRDAEMWAQKAADLEEALTQRQGECG
jgi:hypothetical protein